MPQRLGRFILVFLALLPSVPVCAQIYVDANASTGVTVPLNFSQQLGRGACFGDFDRDGDQDLLAAEGIGSQFRYYRNDGNGSFSDQTVAAGLSANYGFSHLTRAIVAADIDNDGDLDAFVANSYSADWMLINDGTGSFVDEAAVRGLGFTGGSWTVSFGDFDRDGWLDLYLGVYNDIAGGTAPNILYRNTGGGNFVDVTATAGVGDLGLIFTGIWHDYDEDGWPDLFIGNDKGWYPGLQPDTTFRNNGDGTFTDVGLAIGTRFGIGAMGADFTDIDNDGGWDIFVSNTQAGHLLHVWDPATLTYLELANAYGVAAFTEGWGCNFYDVDNDGWQDLYITNAAVGNHLFRNTGPGTVWPEIGTSANCAIGSTKFTLALVDYDNDGGIDLFQPRPYTTSTFLRHTTTASMTANNWVKVRLEGTRSNRDGFGAIVTVTAGGLTQRQQMRSGVGYLGSSDLRLHYGLGAAPSIDRIHVWWPSGQETVLLNQPVNQELHVIEQNLSSTAPVLGGLTTISFEDVASAGLPYASVLQLSPGPGLVLSDGRQLLVNLADPIAQLTLAPTNPIYSGGVGTIDLAGLGAAGLFLPNDPALSGLTLQAVGVTAHPQWPDGIKTIFSPLPMVLP